MPHWQRPVSLGSWVEELMVRRVRRLKVGVGKGLKVYREEENRKLRER